MTGQELFHALSYVDERYIMEAETARLRSGIPWMKVLSVAACLCILIAGAFALEHTGLKGVTEEAAPEAAAPPAAAPEAAPEAAPKAEAAPEAAEPEVMPEEIYSESEAGEERIPGELLQIPYARLRVTNLNDDGSFEAIVEEADADTNLFEAQMQVTVIVDPSRVVDADAEITNDLSVLHTDAQIEIENGTYDTGMSILYVAEVIFLCRGDH